MDPGWRRRPGLGAVERLIEPIIGAHPLNFVPLGGPAPPATLEMAG
jgi:hypothetical protein